MQNRRGNVLGAFILIAVGVWFLAQNVGIELPSLGEIWPALLVLGGLVALGNYVSGHNRDSDQIFSAVLGLLLGAFFFVFTLGLSLPLPGLEEGVGWEDMARLWPVFPLIVGLAILAQFVVGPKRDWGGLTFGLLALVVGVVALPFTLGMWPADLGLALFKFWPLALIVVGLAALLQAIFRRR
ncbi:MAG: hypothetical protein JW850_01215 [Thermoflexales bacterium]|nr:hypothetical protein [Thermoflexales bacterium]